MTLIVIKGREARINAEALEAFVAARQAEYPGFEQAIETLLTQEIGNHVRYFGTPPEVIRAEESLREMLTSEPLASKAHFILGSLGTEAEFVDSLDILQGKCSPDDLGSSEAGIDREIAF
ncbi:hypothetical protein ACEUZ9_000870 [Paracoccus litorisediminis]|uniref:hypothetical protein n=1 Tax=Paracoccus litorisediminis TaxID=2006130 RepID=UPI0037323F71